MMAVVGCLTYEFQVSLPLIAGTTFQGDARTYGFLTACMGIGAVVGGLIAAGRRRGGPQRLVTTAAAVRGRGVGGRRRPLTGGRRRWSCSWWAPAR